MLMIFRFTILIIISDTLACAWYPQVWLLNQLPGPKGLPLIGSALEVVCDNAGKFLYTVIYITFRYSCTFWDYTHYKN